MKTKIVLAVLFILSAAGYAIADSSWPVSSPWPGGAAAGVQRNLPICRGPDGGVSTNPACGTSGYPVTEITGAATCNTPDGGFNINSGSLPTCDPTAWPQAKDGGTAQAHDPGLQFSTTGCVQAYCSTVGDGGTLGNSFSGDGGSTDVGYVLTPGPGVLTVDENSAVRIGVNTACNQYGVGGVGKQVPSGKMIQFPAISITPGSPWFSCCANTATATSPMVEWCPTTAAPQ